MKEHSETPRDRDGNPLFTWDKCPHPRESLFLDCEVGWLVCTACALVLKENALQMLSDGDGRPKQTVSIRGADAEYNEWRSGELDLADAMEKLGVVDNDAAFAEGRARSIWGRRERALLWLDIRRRIRATWKHRCQLAMTNGDMNPPEMVVPPYTRHGVLPHVPYEPNAALQPEPVSSISAATRRPLLRETQQLRFKGGLCETLQRFYEEEEEEIDLYAVRAARELKYQPPPQILRRRRCLQRWESVARAWRAYQKRLNRYSACDMLEHEREAAAAVRSSPRAVVGDRLIAAAALDLLAEMPEDQRLVWAGHVDSEEEEASLDEEEEEEVEEREVEWELT